MVFMSKHISSRFADLIDVISSGHHITICTAGSVLSMHSKPHLQSCDWLECFSKQVNSFPVGNAKNEMLVVIQRSGTMLHLHGLLAAINSTYNIITEKAKKN